jgi:hypothetical protein
LQINSKEAICVSFVYLFYYCCPGGTLWHLPKVLTLYHNWMTPSIILLSFPALHSWTICISYSVFQRLILHPFLLLCTGSESLNRLAIRGTVGFKKQTLISTSGLQVDFKTKMSLIFLFLWPQSVSFDGQSEQSYSECYTHCSCSLINHSYPGTLGWSVGGVLPEWASCVLLNAGGTHVGAGTSLLSLLLLCSVMKILPQHPHIIRVDYTR